MPHRLLSNLTAAGMLLAGALLAARLAADYRLSLFPALQGFAPRPEFSLLDSLPALAPGMSELEAFKFTADASSATNADRSIWLDDSSGALSLEYYSGKTVHDSTTFLVWTSDSVLASRTLKDARVLAWKIPHGKRVHTWTEAVGVYVSHPRFLKLQAADTAITPFEWVEGKTMHIVRRRYRDRKEKPVPADTAYPVGGAGELQMLARGDALAIVNPSPRSVRLRIIRVTEKRWDICDVKAGTTQVYRSLLKGLDGPVLAYTSAGNAHPLWNSDPQPVAYFWLDRSHGRAR